MSTAPIRTGIIGLGRSGWDIHAMTLAKHDSYQVTAVADPEADRRKEAEENFNCKAYANWEEMVRDNDVELVVIATPSHTHAEMTCAALRAGKHVVVEKPMAVNTAEADAMIACAREQGRLLSVFHPRRFDATFLKVREIIESGVLGSLQVVRLNISSYMRRRDWQTLRKFGGGQLNNTGPHVIDHALMLSGGVWDNLRADLRRIASAGDADDYAHVSFNGQDGTAFYIEVSNAIVLSAPGWQLIGKYGGLIGNSNKLQVCYYDASTLPEPIVNEGPAANRSYSSGEELPWVEETIECSGGNIFRLFYDALTPSIRGDAPLAVPADEIRNLMALLEACHEQAGF